MPVDWYQVADMAVRGVGGVLFITFAYLLFRALKKCASEMFGAVRGHATGNGTGSGDPNETTTAKAADHTAYQGHAVKAAQQIIADACDRRIVRPEHAQFYEFVLAAARAVLDSSGGGRKHWKENAAGRLAGATQGREFSAGSERSPRGSLA